MSLECALLGFLSYGPLTGYELKKRFDNAIASFWTVPQSQIYTTLHRMNKNGLVTSEIIPQDTRPNRRLYQLTDSGRDSLQQWLAKATSPAATRDPVLLQLWLSGLVDDETVIETLSTHVERLSQRLKLLLEKPKGKLDSQDDPPRDRFFWWMTLNYGIQHLRFQIAWLEDTIDRIRREDYKFGKDGALRGLLDNGAQEEVE
ncbi:PadR family transcriptional regulator [Candidatus Bipolaricaulota bacterium]